MSMESKHTPGVIRNVFGTLDRDETLLLVGLCLAQNDLVSNLEAIGIVPEGENSYFFYSSIAIVREAAKLVDKIEKSSLTDEFSSDTAASFQELMAILAPFHDTSLAKSVLKPIRDVTFHYDFTGSNSRPSWTTILDCIARLSELDVGLVPDDQSLLGQRYFFADAIRTDYVNQYLTKDVVSEISAVSVRIGVFVDLLLTDLVRKLERR